jgi:hypothetical protein
MSFPFESRSHAALRRRLMAAMGLLPACIAEPDLLDDGGELNHLDAGDISAPGRDGSTMIVPDAGKGCEYGPPARACLSRTELENQARWGLGGRERPSEPLRSDAEIAAMFLPNGCMPREHAHSSCCNPALTEATVAADGTCCYEFCTASCCGRPFVIEGKVRTARAMRRDDWLSGLPELAGKSLPVALRERAAAEWLEDARMEHASVAAFARFTLELLAFGAPADLVTESQLAGLDEVDHARLCFALASRYAGADLGPTALSMAQVAPASSLRESVLSAVIEGCIGETLAAARARAALESARDQATRSVLAKIAEDEARHAELAYRYVAWALTREPQLASDIQELVTRESGLLASGVNSKVSGPQVDMLEPALTLLGRLSPARGNATHASTFAQVILPCITSLLENHANALADGATRGYAALA